MCPTWGAAAGVKRGDLLVVLFLLSRFVGQPSPGISMVVLEEIPDTPPEAAAASWPEVVVPVAVDAMSGRLVGSAPLPPTARPPPRPHTPPRGEPSRPERDSEDSQGHGPARGGGPGDVSSRLPGRVTAALAAFQAQRYNQVRTLLTGAPTTDVPAQLLLRRARLAEGLVTRAAQAQTAAASGDAPLLALQQLLVQLEVSSHQAGPQLLLALTKALGQCGRAGAALVYATGSHARLVRHMGPPTVATAAAVLRGAGPMLPGPAARLAAVAAASKSPVEAAAAALAVLRATACAPGPDGAAMRLLALTPVEGPRPLRWLAGLAAAGGLSGHCAASIDLASIFASFASDAASRAALREADVAPLAALLALERAQRAMPQAAMGTSQHTAVRRAALRAFAALCEDPFLVRTEAFTRRSGKAAAVAVTPTKLLSHMVDALRGALATSASRPCPVLGWDGRPKSFCAAPYAADVDAGEAATADCCVAHALTSLRAILRASPRNAARVLQDAACVDALAPVFKGFDASTPASAALRRDAELCAGAIAAGCAPAAEEACTGDDIGPLAGLLCLPPGAIPEPSLVARAAGRLSVLIPTCSGDAFWHSLLAMGGAVQAMHTALRQHVEATAATAADVAVWAGDPRSACLLACVERCRAAGLWGAYFESIGQAEVSRMEAALKGRRPPVDAAPATPTPTSPRQPPAAKARVPVAAQKAAAHGIPAVAPSHPPAKPAPPAGGAAPTRQKPLPWDPPASVPNGGALATGGGGDQPLIRKGFLSHPPRRGARHPAAKPAQAPPSAAGGAHGAGQPADSVSPVVAEPLPEEEPLACEVGSGPGTDDAPRDPTRDDSGYDADGLRVTWDSGGLGAAGAAQRAARAAWLALELRQKVTWHQDSEAVHVAIAVPAGTKHRDVAVTVTPTRLTVRLGWHGRVVDGPLARRCKASESVWSLGEGGTEVLLLLPKDDPYFWRALFEGGEEKSHYEVLRELVQADERVQSLEEVDGPTRDLVLDLQEHQAMVNEGLIDPVHGFDDFRLVIGDGDGAK